MAAVVVRSVRVVLMCWCVLMRRRSGWDSVRVVRRVKVRVVRLPADGWESMVRADQASRATLAVTRVRAGGHRVMLAAVRQLWAIRVPVHVVM